MYTSRHRCAKVVSSIWSQTYYRAYKSYREGNRSFGQVVKDGLCSHFQKVGQERGPGMLARMRVSLPLDRILYRRTDCQARRRTRGTSNRTTKSYSMPSSFISIACSTGLRRVWRNAWKRPWKRFMWPSTHPSYVCYLSFSLWGFCVDVKSLN